MNGNVEIITAHLPTGWQWRKLGEICQVNPRRPSNLQLDANQLTTFVPMAAVDATSGTISCAETKVFSEVSRGYTYFEEEDVLFAKITPCMENGKHIIARNLIHGIGFGTTEFHVVRSGPEIIPEWIHKYLRQQRILLQAKKHFRGAVGQQRLPKEFLADLSIPLPPLAEQERIVRILDEKLAAIDKAKQAAETQLEATNALPQAYLREQIPSYEDSLPNGWRLVKLGEKGVFRVESGGTPKSGIREYWNGGVSWITLVDLPDSDIITEITSTNRTISETGLKNSAAILLPANSVVVSSRATIGRIGINRIPLATNQGFKNIVIEDTTQAIPEYVAFAITELVPAMQAQASGSTYKEIIKSRFSQLQIPLPPLAEQERIVRILNEKLTAVEKVKEASNTRIDTINAMSAAYLRRAFAGEL